MLLWLIACGAGPPTFSVAVVPHGSAAAIPSYPPLPIAVGAAVDLRPMSHQPDPDSVGVIPVQDLSWGEAPGPAFSLQLRDDYAILQAHAPGPGELIVEGSVREQRGRVRLQVASVRASRVHYSGLSEGLTGWLVGAPYSVNFRANAADGRPLMVAGFVPEGLPSGTTSVASIASLTEAVLHFTPPAAGSAEWATGGTPLSVRYVDQVDGVDVSVQPGAPLSGLTLSLLAGDLPVALPDGARLDVALDGPTDCTFTPASPPIEVARGPLVWVQRRSGAITGSCDLQISLHSGTTLTQLTTSVPLSALQPVPR